MAGDFEGATPEKLAKALMRPVKLKVIAGAPNRPLAIGGIEIQCYVLEDKTRVLSQSGMLTGMNLSRRGFVSLDGAAQVPRFAASKAINPYISNDLAARLGSPIEFQPPGGGRTAYGYPATIFVDLCKAILAARDAGVLKKNQARIAERADLLVRGLATVGIIALVDEATGYQEVRERHALATILEKFIAEELQPWTKTFPYEFYAQIFRLRDWSGPPRGVGSRGPRVIAKYTNNIVYERLAPGVLDELKRINPKLQRGGRRHKHHQWFTPDIGHPKLKEHLAAVIALMRAASNWSSFQRMLNRAFPTKGKNIPLPLEDDDGK